MDDETWLIDIGQDIIVKKAEQGVQSLNPKEKLIYCLWVADYCIRNAGDLEQANEIHNGYKDEILKLSNEMGYNVTLQMFSLSEPQLIEQYYDLFNSVCDEIRN